jgi:hypothetical protein
MRYNSILMVTLLVALCISACKKRPDLVHGDGEKNTPTITLQFENVVGSRSLVLNNQSYTNAAGDTFTVTTFRYYISNVHFIDINNNEYAVPESYHLTDHQYDSTHKYVISDIPSNKYKAMRFLIGVDSVKNVSGAQTGALSVSNGMFWDWNTGYTMMKLEGQTPQSDTKYLTYHTGGYKGENSVLKWVTLPFAETQLIDTVVKKTIHLKVDVTEIFKTPHTLSFKDMSLVMSTGPAAKKIADNYADMFSIDHID